MKKSWNPAVNFYREFKAGMNEKPSVNDAKAVEPSKHGMERQLKWEPVIIVPIEKVGQFAIASVLADILWEIWFSIPLFIRYTICIFLLVGITITIAVSSIISHCDRIEKDRVYRLKHVPEELGYKIYQKEERTGFYSVEDIDRDIVKLEKELIELGVPTREIVKMKEELTKKARANIDECDRMMGARPWSTWQRPWNRKPK